MPTPKQSVLIPIDGGLSNGDTSEYTVEPNNTIVAENLVHRENGSVQSAPYLSTGTDNYTTPATVAVLNGKALLAADAVYNLDDYTNPVEIPSSATLASMAVHNAQFTGNRMVAPHAAAMVTGQTCTAAWNIDSNSIEYMITDPSGAVIKTDTFISSAFNPRVCVVRYTAGGASTVSEGYRFVIGAKLDAGGFHFSTYTYEGVYVAGGASALGWNATYKNGWVMESSTTEGSVVAVCLNTAGTDIISHRVLPGTSSTLVGTVTNTRAVIGGGRAGATNGYIYVVADGATDGLLIVYDGIGAPVGSVALPPECTGLHYNIAGVAVSNADGYVAIFRTAFERDATEVLPPAITGTHYECCLGDPRSFPALGATEASTIASTLRVGTYRNLVAIPALTIHSSALIPGVGILGNGSYKNGVATMPYEWGFPCAVDNARPSSGATSFNGKPFPATADMPTGVYTYPFNLTTNLRPQSFRPPLHNSQYPPAEESIAFALGASIEEQEGQAHYAYVAHNATVNFQEGRLGIIMSSELPGSRHTVVSAFLSTRISSRSNAAANRAKNTFAAQGSITYMLSSRVDAVAANAPYLPGLAIPTCDMVNYASGKFALPVCVASDVSYYGRSIRLCQLKTVATTPSLAADSASQMATFGSMPCAIGSLAVTPGFIPRPTHIALWGQQILVGPGVAVDYNIQQRSTFQGDPSYYVEHGYVFVRYRVKIGNGQYLVSQLSPPLAVTCRPGIHSTFYWTTENTIHSEDDSRAETYWREYGPYIYGLSNFITTAPDPVQGKAFRRAVIVPAIPWFSDEQVEVDVYVDDVGTDIDVAKTGGGFWASTSFTTYSIGRPAAGQPRYVGTVKPERLPGTMAKWLGFYFGTADSANPLTYELGSFAPTPALGVSEPIAADALEATPVVPATPISISSYGDRILAFCSDGRDEVWISKPSVKGVYAQFSDELVANIPVDGGRVVAGVAFEERLIVFKRDRILVSSGQLPDATGSGGSLSEFSPLTSEVGCISKGSILTTPLGIVFESARGFCLLTPGGSVDYIGGQVSDLSGLNSAQNCVSATLNTVTGECLFSMASTLDDSSICYVLVWNYRFGKWSQLTLPAGSGVTSLASNDGQVWAVVSSDDQYTPAKLTSSSALNDNLDTMRVSTGWIKPNGLSGYFRVSRATVLGKVQSGVVGTSRITVRSFANYSDTLDSEAEFDLADVTDASGNIRAVFYPITQKCQAIRLEIEVQRFNSSDSIGNDVQVSVFGVQLDVSAKAGSFKSIGAGSRG